MGLKGFGVLAGAVLGVVSLGGCPRAPSAPVDAGVDVPHDVAGDGRVARRRRVRRARGPRPTGQTTVAQQGAHNGGTTNEPDEEVDDGPRVRPRITETGPMLPEDLGPPINQTMDFGGSGADEGPMGLEPNQVRRAMDPLTNRCAVCAEATTTDDGRGPRGRVSVRMRVRADGSPVAARVSGGGGPAEFVTCVRRVVASARFDRFRGPDVIVTWGFEID